VRLRCRIALTAGGAVALVIGAALPAGATTIPSRIYGPYFETWTKHNIATVAAKSGVKYFTLAFIQSEGKHGVAACTPAWDGDRKQPVSAGRYLAQIKRLRKDGGDVIPSFGGFSADQGLTEIADSCTSVPAIAAAYEQVITTYHVSTLDMDVEARSLTHAAGITRRSEAIAMAQAWARARGIRLRIQFTIGIEPSGLDKQNLGVVRSAVAHGVTGMTANLMVFDYYLGNEKTQEPMAKLAIEAVTRAHAQLARVFPHLSAAQVWHLEGMTLLPGIDDYPKKTEVTSLANAQTMMKFALAHHMNFLSIWAIQRDHGGCVGAVDSNSCSGIAQASWAFSHALEGFTK
jgi:hypothetical protein